MLPSWHDENWNQLQQRIAQNKMPHAILLTGNAGLGKQRFARHLANVLLCETPADGHPCGQCKACQMFRADTHPDLRYLCPAAEGKAIVVDQIRELGGFLSLTRQGNRNKVAVVMPADQMNRNAANSLLKNLEEPAPATIIILVTDRATALPATIRSRCQRLEFRIPPVSVARDWLSQQPGMDAGAVDLLLSLAHGAPYAALALAESDLLATRQTLFDDFQHLATGRDNPVSVAERWLKTDPQQSLHWLYSWLTDVVRLRVTDHPPDLTNTDFRVTLQELGKQVDLATLHKLLDRVLDGIGLLRGQANIQLVLENLFIEWQKVCQPRRKQLT
jgi:DNA polymerase-3 subunit delta'